METLYIEPTDDTPKITMNKGDGVFEISGRSLPEDSAEFYEPVIEWLENYVEQPNDNTEFNFKLDYSNTASSKFVHEILNVLQTLKNVKVIWWFHEEDEDMEEAGIEFSEQIDIPFEFKAYQ